MGQKAVLFSGELEGLLQDLILSSSGVRTVSSTPAGGAFWVELAVGLIDLGNRGVAQLFLCPLGLILC